MIEFFKNNEEIAETLGDKDKANELLNSLIVTTYNLAVEQSLRTLPRIVMRQLNFYGEVNKKIEKFFLENEKYKNVRHIFKTKLDMLSVVNPEKEVEELLQLTAIEIDKEFGL